MTENTILEVLREQQLEVQAYNPTNWCSRYEEQFFEWESNLAQVVTGVRRSGKSTLCHKVLLDRGIKYGYANLDDDRLMSEDIYYYKPTSRSKEVDFVVCHQGVVKELIQVAYSIDDKNTYKREVESLSMAATKLNCTHLTLIAFTDTRDVEFNNQTIHIQSATDWLSYND